VVDAQLGVIVRHVHRLAGSQTLEELEDGALLERFAVQGEEAAFATLVQRHGPMVLGVCRRVLQGRPDADDAFQATFLVLFRRAAALDRSRSVANWIYTVAYHVALRARAATARRQRHEREVHHVSRQCSSADIVLDDLQPVLDEELNRLPEKYRAPILLCYLEGKTNEAAARLLRCPVGTVKGRLARARALLRARLAKRGITLSSGVLAAILAEHATAAVPAALAEAAVRTTVLVAAGMAACPTAETLAQGVLQTFLRTKLKIAVTLLLFIGGIMAGIGLFHSGAGARTTDDPTPPVAFVEGADSKTEKDKPGSTPKDEKPDVAEKKGLAVAGTVVDADGKPVADAHVAVIGLAQPRFRGNVGYQQYETLGTGTTDKEGHFRFDCVAESATRLLSRQVLASAPKHGLGWQPLKRTDERTDVVVKLPPEQVVRGRLIDLQGQAIKGVKLHVASIAPGQEGYPYTPPAFTFTSPPKGLDLWPAPLTTDGEGRFVIHGLPSDAPVRLLVNDERFARQQLIVQKAKGKPEEFEEALEPARMLEGKVVAEDTGKPIGKVLLSIFAAPGQEFQEWTDEQGRFRFNCPPTPGGIGIAPFAPDGSAYLTRVMVFDWPKGKVKHEVEVRLPRGVMVRGKVTEAGSDKPVAGAVVSYYVREDNPLARGPIVSWRRVPGEFVQTRADGTFEAAVFPGKGHLMVKGPTSDYVMKRIEFGELGPTVGTMYTHAVTAVDLKAGADASEVNLKLQRGVKIAGRVVDSDGKPVKQAVLLYHDRLRDDPDRAYQSLNFGHNLDPVAVKDGRFELTGCDPRAKLRLVVLDRKNEIGAVATLSPEEQKEEPTIRLEPCARATFHIVDEKGKPFPMKGAGQAIENFMFMLLDPELHEPLYQFVVLGPDHRFPEPDEKGRITIPCLIPGADYRSPYGNKQKFTPEAGKTHDLGDIIFRVGGSNIVPF
jgi:RNA polymerase sigma factor (sigma-70 family)